MPVAKVQLPDGRIARFEVPEGTTEAEVKAAAQGLLDNPPATSHSGGSTAQSAAARRLFENTPTHQIAEAQEQLVPRAEMPAGHGGDNNGSRAAIRAGAERFADNLVAVPDAIVSSPMANRQLNPLQRLMATAATFSPNVPAPRGTLPGGGDVVAGVDAAMNVPGGLLGTAARGESPNLAQRFEDSQAEAAALRQQHPTASTVGRIGGDAATLLTGRLPLARLANPRTLPQVVPRNLEPGARRALDRLVNSGASTSLARGIRRAGETSFEGAVLATLDQADPFETALYAGAAQAAGSGALTVGNFLKRHPVAGLGLAAVITASGIQAFKSAVPGGRDRISESIESGFDKVVTLGALAAAAGIAGAGRGRGSLLAEDFPKVVEGSTALLRGSMLSILKDAISESERGITTTEQTLNHLAVNPTRFSDEQRTAIERGFKKGNLSEVTQRLAAEDQSFAAIIDSAPQPFSMQDGIRDSVREDTRDAPLISANRVAETIAKRVPERLKRDQGPRTFISDVFGDKDIGNVLGRLGSRQRMDALEANLDAMITRSTKQAGDRRIIDAAALRTRWDQLPDAARSAYSKTQRANIEALIAAAESEALSVLPPLLARSLMLPDGHLSRQLRGKE